MAARVFYRIPLNYNDVFGSETPEDEWLAWLDEEISKLLPDNLVWCGDELLIEIGDEEPAGFDFNEIVSEAFENLMARINA